MLTTGCVLRFDRKIDGFLFAEFVACPQAIKEVETQVPPECFLDHFSIALACARGAHFHRPQDFLIDRKRRPRLHHKSIIA